MANAVKLESTLVAVYVSTNAENTEYEWSYQRAESAS